MEHSGESFYLQVTHDQTTGKTMHTLFGDFQTYTRVNFKWAMHRGCTVASKYFHLMVKLMQHTRKYFHDLDNVIQGLY